MTGPSRRGDGVGIEFTESVVRGVRLDHDDPDRILAIADVPIREPGVEHSIVDALVRLRGELGAPTVATRVGTFPAGTTLQRVDATGLTGPELNARRAELERRFGIESTMLLDDGPRRWLVTLGWDTDRVRSVEQWVERAGFVDVAVEPSPVAIARVVPSSGTWVRRDAATGEAFRVVLNRNVPVAAITDDTAGRLHPDLAVRDAPISEGLFADHAEPGDLAVLMHQVTEALVGDAGDDIGLVFAGAAYPPYPAHDIRSAQRQCVALGAAVGAAGLAGRARPVDVQFPLDANPHIERPWAIERLTELTDAPSTPVRRATARLRRRGRG